MKKVILTLLFSISFIWQANADSVKIVALINGEIISSEDINNQTKIFMLNSPIPLNAETKNMIHKRVLSQTIEQKLKKQEAEKEGITVAPEELENQLKAWAKKNNTTIASIKSKGINKQTLEDNLNPEIAWVNLKRRKFYQNTTITQKEIDETINEVTEDMGVKKYQVLEIFIKKENAQGINSLVEKLREDPRFELYAAQFSEAPSASNGGNLGWINSGKMLSALEMRLSSMNPGEISDAILIGDGYYIVKLVQVFDPKDNPNFTPNQMEIKTLLEYQKMENLSKKLLQDVKQKAIIEVKK